MKRFVRFALATLIVFTTALVYAQSGWGPARSQATAPAFTPAQLPSLAMWLRSDAGITLNSGHVSQWNDQSGNGNNATQGTAADQPAFVTNVLRGFPAVNFTGAQFLGHPLGATTSNFTVWAVVSAGQPAAGQYQCLYGNSGGVTFATSNGAAGNPWGIYLNGNTFATSQVITSAGDNVFHNTTVAVVSPTGAVTFSTDGTVTTGTGSGAYAANAGSIGGGNSTQPFVGNLVEMAVYNTVLTVPQIKLLEAYGHARYGI